MQEILARMLARIPAGMDTREGSIIYDALAPAALELKNLYNQLDFMLNETFADTQTRPYLIKRAAERGIIVEAATHAIRQGEFEPDSLEIPLGTRFSLSALNFEVVEKIEAGVYRLRCESAGNAGNISSGRLIPIDYIEGLESAILTEVLIPGEDEEDTEHLRQRYFDSLNSQAFGGNIAYYKEKVKAIDGVGGVKVFPVWNGGGTVKIVIIASDFSPPSNTLIEQVQTIIDPLPNQGQGYGVAPIGHVVTVNGCIGAMINVSATFTLQDGYIWDDILPSIQNTIDSYFHELATEWDSLSNIVVRISQIESRILDISGIIDIEGTKINNAAQNLSLNNRQIPVLNMVINNA